jgi:hypothetical protein
MNGSHRRDNLSMKPMIKGLNGSPKIGTWMKGDGANALDA